MRKRDGISFGFIGGAMALAFFIAWLFLIPAMPIGPEREIFCQVFTIVSYPVYFIFELAGVKDEAFILTAVLIYFIAIGAGIGGRFDNSPRR